MCKFITTFVLAIFCFLAFGLQAQKISIQSTLKDISGKAIPDGDVSVTFRLYPTAIGGDTLWNESTIVSVVGGIYSHKLGSVTPLNPTNFGGNLYLGVTIAGGQELSPRTELTAAPFAVSVKSIADNNQSARFLNDGTLNVTGNMSVNGNSSFKNAHVQDNLTNVWDLTIGGPTHGINRNNGYLEIGCNNTGRFIMNDDGTNQINSQNNKPINFNIGNTKFQADQFGAVTYGRHDIYGNLALETGRDFNMNSGNINISNSNGGNRWIRLGDSDTGLRSTSEGVIQLMSNDYPVISAIPYNGGGQRNVGINFPNPLAPLHVGWAYNNDPIGYEGYSSDYTGFSYHNGDGMHYANSFQALGGPDWPSLYHVCAIFEGSIVSRKGVWSANNFSYSDKRTKNVIDRSNSAMDLSLLNKIVITDYTMIDKVQDNNKYKKVIAQEVQDVYPQAVTRSRNVIPDIMSIAASCKYANGSLTITIGKEHNLRVGDHIDLIAKEEKLIDVEVINVIDDKRFVVKSERELTKIFVYGKYVDDFLGVDYDALSMLNISATQELYKKIVALENENKALKTTTSSLEERMSKLEAMLTNGNTAAQNTNTVAGQR